MNRKTSAKNPTDACETAKNDVAVDFAEEARASRVRVLQWLKDRPSNDQLATLLVLSVLYDRHKHGTTEREKGVTEEELERIMSVFERAMDNIDLFANMLLGNVSVAWPEEAEDLLIRLNALGRARLRESSLSDTPPKPE